MSLASKIHSTHGSIQPSTTKAKGAGLPPVSIPTGTGPSTGGLKTPKTPQDEGIDFFESDVAASGEQAIQVYELRLDPDGGPNKERAYTRLPPPFRPYILRVSLAAGTPASKNGVLKTNFPLDGGKFGRFDFIERKLPTDFSKPIKIDLPISYAGAFTYWIEYDGPDGKRVKGREGYFNIDPVLRVKARPPILSPENKPLYVYPSTTDASSQSLNLGLDGLAILTVVSKWMGTLEEWGPHFAEARDRGYNMLHYTPLQQRGESRSPYSIADQLAFDAELFASDWKGDTKEGVQKVAEIL